MRETPGRKADRIGSYRPVRRLVPFSFLRPMVRVRGLVDYEGVMVAGLVNGDMMTEGLEQSC